jgi:hypothetical protein
MSLARVKVWVPGDTLTASDLNGEFNNLVNNPISLISPSTGAINFNLQAHTNLIPAAISASSGSTGALLTISTDGSPVWTTSGASAVSTSISTPPPVALVVTRTTSALAVSADEIKIGSQLISNLNVTVQSTATGANGLDTGALAANTFYYLWAIYNSTAATAAAIISLSETTPTLPAGYSSSLQRLIGGVGTASSGAQFREGTQLDHVVSYTNPCIISTAITSTSINTADLSNLVPSSGVRAVWLASTHGNVAALFIHYTSSNFSAASTAAFIVFDPGPAGNAKNFGPNRLPTFRSSTRSTIFYINSANSNTNALYLVAWEMGYRV